MSPTVISKFTFDDDTAFIGFMFDHGFTRVRTRFIAFLQDLKPVCLGVAHLLDGDHPL